MHGFVHLWSSHSIDRDRLGSRLLSLFLYKMILYLLTNLFIGVTIFYWEVFQVGEGNQQSGQPLTLLLL